jgi:hypothetical protein
MLGESEILSGYLLGVLFGCLSILFFDFCFCFSVFCFCPFSLSFFPPLSPITSLLFLLSKTSSHGVVSVATTAGPSLLIVILHTFQNQSIAAFKEAANALATYKVLRWYRGKCIALMSIIELAYVLFAYFSVNYLPGLHTYLND